MDKSTLVKLCSRTWSLTALGLMADGIAGRTSPLAAAAGCGRTAMQASVAHLVELNLLEKNAGYGHPMRSAYRLTEQGMHLAQWASQLNQLVTPGADRQLLRSKWSLPLISCLPGYTRYGELRRQLNPVTDRALSRSLGQLTERRWISRQVLTRQSPPAVIYSLAHTGSNLFGHLQKLTVE